MSEWVSHLVAKVLKQRCSFRTQGLEPCSTCFVKNICSNRTPNSRKPTRLHALPTEHFPRHQCNGDDAAQRQATCKVQDAVDG